MDVDNGSAMTTLLWLLLFLFTPSLWPLAFPALIAIVFGMSVFASSPVKDQPVSDPHVAESSAPDPVNQKGN